MIKKLPTGARKFAVIAVISALCAVWTGLDSIRYYFSHKSCTEHVTAHAEHVEMSLDKSGYTYTVDYTYEFGGSDHNFEAVFITKETRDINYYYSDKDILIDPDAPDKHFIRDSRKNHDPRFLVVAVMLTIVCTGLMLKKIQDEKDLHEVK